ncbi:aminotransferase class V-fold PLP-dependent enzyme [Gimibacter soli]|uniref:Aminotransferase class V-fold PLP-dependent enzyme n=1 Tax=Gimibacter soli TaxID=3024400 RepID=A0AAE9XUV3_9PROT|nr:aminotransferase class V-fold PLP-dependent enzyme [Gimibacter soli]WCL53214.1 aminotransferase class V-fold PLP-dependent enzyme [Gimibacter soli]
MPEQNLNDLRNDTPGAATRLHLDNAGSALMPRPVIERMEKQLKLEAETGGYVGQERTAAEMDGVYMSLAALFGGKTADYALTSGAVDAWTRLFYSVPFEPGDNLVTGYNEYCANYVAYLHQAERRGIEIRVAPPGANGELDVAALESLVDARTRLISLVHVPSSSGQVNPVAAVGKVARAKGVPFLLDAAQSAGHVPVNVDEIGCDMMIGTARKFLRGPRGVGFLYVKPEMRRRLELAFVTNNSAWVATDRFALRDDARAFEAWERNVVAVLGFGAALGYFRDHGPAELMARALGLADRLRSGLASLPGVTMTCPPGAYGAIVTFRKEGHDPAAVKALLEAEGIAVNVASVAHTRIDLEARGVDTTLRASPHYYLSEEDIDRFVERIGAL